jgi:hypothetical protein
VIPACAPPSCVRRSRISYGDPMCGEHSLSINDHVDQRALGPKALNERLMRVTYKTHSLLLISQIICYFLIWRIMSLMPICGKPNTRIVYPKHTPDKLDIVRHQRDPLCMNRRQIAHLHDLQEGVLRSLMNRAQCTGRKTRAHLRHPSCSTFHRHFAHKTTERGARDTQAKSLLERADFDRMRNRQSTPPLLRTVFDFNGEECQQVLATLEDMEARERGGPDPAVLPWTTDCPLRGFPSQPSFFWLRQ